MLAYGTLPSVPMIIFVPAKRLLPKVIVFYIFVCMRV